MNKNFHMEELSKKVENLEKRLDLLERLLFGTKSVKEKE